MPTQCAFYKQDDLHFYLVFPGTLMFNKRLPKICLNPVINIGVASKKVRPVPNEQLEPSPTAWITHLQEPYLRRA